MPEVFIFHESFDSTRTADGTAQPNLAQAQAEALVSLLLGHTLAVNNTYGFDSRGVLELASVVLAARDEVRSHLKPGTAPRERLTKARPFLLCWYRAGSFFEACANQLRNINEESLDERFLLSAWKAIDLDAGRRRELADCLLNPPGPAGPFWLNEYDRFPEMWDMLQAINRYASEYDRGRAASQAQGTDLIAYLNHYHELGANGGPLPELAARWGCPADIAMALWNRLDMEMARAAAEEKEKDRKRLESRSWVHVAVSEAREAHADDLELLERLKELIDTFYNARLSQSVYARHGFMSSVPRSADNDLQEVNDLAVGLIGHVNRDTRTPPLRGAFTAPADEPQLPVAPLRRLFQDFWEVIADDERCGIWRGSCKRMTGLLDMRPAESGSAERRNWNSEFKDAWDDHLSLLSRQLPEVVRTDDSTGTLRVAVQPGQAMYQQALRSWSATDENTRPLTADEADTLLATGRYVSDLAGSAGK
jgi:hypothetical protein